jgi:hypothetical protein
MAKVTGKYGPGWRVPVVNGRLPRYFYFRQEGTTEVIEKRWSGLIQSNVRPF